jgi:hypothetical protein
VVNLRTIPVAHAAPPEKMHMTTRSIFRSPRLFGAALALGALALTGAATATPTTDATPLADADTPYSIEVTNAKAKVGEDAKIVIKITAVEGYKCNKSYPHKARKLKADAGAELAADMVKGTLENKQIVIPVSVKATKAGTFKVTGQIKFSVCNDSQCVIKKAPLNATITGE